MLRKAILADVKQIQSLINFYAQRGEVLPRSRSELYEDLRDFYVFEEDGEIIGACALHLNWEDLAEIRSLTVRETAGGRGIGSELVRACLNEAKEFSLSKIFALTYRQEFFEKLGFKRIDKSQLPQKVWRDCIKCIKFPECDEEAVIIELDV
jgi:amino-acid N-acetyltransferase